ncbi:MAG: MBL fold metallo-hydrolase [Actinomycetota bacterium]|nr:MBL fold metallo-hydrolase [Actinomycetota bacterium]
MTAFAGPHHIRSVDPPRLVEVAEGVYAYVQLPGGWCVSNAGVVASPDGALVIDTLATESRAKRLAEAVDSLRPGPARTVVNTHHHGDHNFGNHVFGPSALIIGHELARIEMAETGLALTTLWPGLEWGDVRVTLPSVTFTDRLTVHIGQHRAELIHVGPAHTTNDVVVWLPDDEVLFAGDVVLSGVAPFLLMGSVRGSLDAVATLSRLGACTVVCGHGPVAGPEVFEQTLEYLRWIEQLAAEGAAHGLSPLELAREAGLGEFTELLDPERIVGNLHRAYAELDGEQRGRALDVVAIFGEMVAYNNGRLPACLA